jgi:DNA-binding NarL/FixJ family response regulator
MTTFRIVLADDHALMREGIRRLIQETPGLTVSGEAGDGPQLLKLIRKAPPDMVILDISMPGLSGIDIAREVHARHPEVAVLFLSMHKKKEYLKMALAAGAKGYLLKENTAQELLEAIAAIRSGRTYLSGSLIEAFSTDIMDIFREIRTRETSPLTPREQQVLKLIADGYTSAQIGEMLFISERTVHRHRSNIREKLNLKKTADLVKYAIHKNMVSLE